MKKHKQLFPALIFSAVFAVMPLAGGAQVIDADFQNSLSQLRETRQAFKDAKTKEADERQQVAREKNQTRLQQAEQRRLDAQKKKEEQRKAVIFRLIEIQIKHLNRTKERVGLMANIEAQLKAQLNTEVDANIQKLNDAKTRVQNATTPEELKTLAKEVRDLFKSYRETVKQIVEAIHASRALGAIAKAEDRAKAIKAKIEELKANGKDTSELDSNLAVAEKEISLAKEAVGKKAFLEANEGLKGAYQKFRGIAEKANGLR